MKRTLNSNMFVDAFRDYGRDREFSRAGLRALFDYLTEIEDETGQEMELDVIALCCDFSEYDSAAEAANEYTQEIYDEDHEQEALEYLRDNTPVIEFNGGVIIQDF